MPHASTRRDFIQSALAGTALAAVAHAVPLPEGQQGTVKVGLLHSLTGTMAISESALKDAELFAIAEINKAGGVLGRQIEPIVEDAESKFIDVFPQKAKKLILRDKVAFLFGCWTSVSRKTVLPVVEDNNALLFYPIFYEGSECSKNVIYTGPLPNQQALPAIDYFWKQGKRKFYLVGCDFILPRYTNLFVTTHLKAKYQATPVGEKYVPIGHQEFGNLVADIKKAQPDVILNSIIGDSLINFFNELAAAKLAPADLPVCSLQISEDELSGLEPSKVKGHFAACSYFQSLDTPRNKDFVKKYQAKYGKDRVLHDPVEAAYAAVWLWKAGVEKAKSFDVDKVREAIRGLEIDAPSGKLKIDEKNQHAWKKFRLGRIRGDRQFDIVHESPDPIRPDPYPPPLNATTTCDWTRGGLIKTAQP